MSSYLSIKRRRDMARQKWQFVAVLVAVTLGVALFAGSFNAYLNLQQSLDSTYERLAMADAIVTVGSDEAVDSLITELPNLDGVETAWSRHVADAAMEVGNASFLGRVIGMPTETQPPINQVDVDEGTLLPAGQPNAVLLESHGACEFELGVGDTITIAGQSAEIVGVVTSPEYLWMAKDRQTTFVPPESFAVVYAADSLFDQLDGPSISRQVMALYADDADTEATDAEVVRVANTVGATDVEPLEDQPSNSVVNEEIGGLQIMAVALPLLFLAAAGLAIYVVVTRIVFAQRGVIGTLRATGLSATSMSRHYRGFGLITGVVGAIIGSVLGAIMARGLTSVYVEVFSIPDLVARFHLPTVVAALAFGAISGTLAAGPPARTVAKMPPAEAMRGDAVEGGGSMSLFERVIPPLRHAPVRWRMSLRGIGRNKKRSLSMVVGVVLGLILILASWGLLDTMRGAMNRQFNEVAVEDGTVFFSVPVDEAALDAVRDVDDVDRVESVVSVAATATNSNDTSQSYASLLEVYDTDTQVHGFDDPLPSSGMVAGHALADSIGVEEGDSVRIEITDLDVSFETTIASFVDEPLSTVFYISPDALEEIAAGADPGTAEAIRAAVSSPVFTFAKALYADGADGGVVTEEIRGIDIVAAAVDGGAMRDTVNDLQAFFYVFVGMMLLFGGAMAFALIFNIISVNVAEREGEFASMRANGLTHRRIANLIMGETFLLVAFGIIPGLIAGYLAAAALMNSYSSDQFPISLSMNWYTYVASAVAMFVVAWLSLLPALRSVKRINVGEVVRERST